MYYFNNTFTTNSIFNWRPLSLIELTLIILNMELTHLDSEASIYYIDF